MIENVRGRVLLVDGNPRVAKFLRINLESAGYNVSIVKDIAAAEEAARLIKVDVIALASSVLEEIQESVSRLRKAMSCPVLVYGLGAYSEAEKRRLNVDHQIDQFYEPEKFLTAVREAMAGKSQCGD